MSNDQAPMAPMPVHNNTDDSLWRTLWNAYEPVITALRRIPLVTNVESGNMFAITAELTDGSHLWISSVEDLPIDPGVLEGFLVKRLHDDIPTIDEVVYDSTDGGEQAEHGNHVVPLIQAITAFVTERGLAPRVIDLISVQLQAVTAQHQPLSELLQGPFNDRQAAVKEYGYATQQMAEEGWTCVHTQGGTDWPLTVWELNGEVATVYLAHVGQAIV
ncbi:hypothetical protein [Streptomyces sp. NBC_00140]|uniref:hypothetical protein n=1 Tax=Streptomyces sp. NBC_00140 TaxID=2975664 RepID=UPI002250135A|nr:hypothetical protein [Streptomyces sp. NBC_00140]MCX5328108.1 hypothetical protein [Streptomyces sp. NBC_00140]